MYIPDYEEKVKITDTMEKICYDLKNIYEQANTDELKTRIKFKTNPFSFYQSLKINRDGIYIGRKFTLFEYNKLMKPNSDCLYLLDIEFIKNYSKNRKRVLKKARSTMIQKEKNARIINSFNDSYEQTSLTPATVKIDMPISNSNHKMTIDEEDGRTIGRIDFGERSIEIITDGDIVLVNKNGKEKIKGKKHM